MKAAKWITLLSAGLLGVACAATTSYPLTSGPEVPAATGTVAVSAGANDNTQLTIQVHHLAPPDKISAGATSYVVWAKPSAQTEARWQNIGALQVSADRKGKLKTVTPIKSATIAITPERSPTVTAPSGPVVMRTEVVR
jgi:hypothetical protein